MRPPEIWSDGERLTVEDALGRNIPPHVHYREALQAVVQVETLRDVVIDPVSFTVYALEPIERSVRPGRVKPNADFLALAFKDETAIDRALIGSTRSADNYYHWLVECMPRYARLARNFPRRPIRVHRRKMLFHDTRAHFPQMEAEECRCCGPPSCGRRSFPPSPLCAGRM